MTDQTFEFVVPGKPLAKGRYRSTREGRRYKDPQTAAYENKVAVFAHQAGARLMEGPLALEIIAAWATPKSKERKRNLRPAEWKTSTPDIDNLAKVVMDGLTGVCWRDDASVVKLSVDKVIAAQGQPAGVSVRVACLVPLVDLRLTTGRTTAWERFLKGGTE